MAEVTCPHCGTGGTPFITAIAVAASVGFVACGVGGPTPPDSDVRVEPDKVVTASPTQSAAPSASAEHPPAPPVDVYGPPPRDPDQREAPSATSTPHAPPPQPLPKPVYGPPPMRPEDRLPPKK